MQTGGSDFCHFQKVFRFRMERGRQHRMLREALIIIGDILREAEDLSEALYNARSKFLFRRPAVFTKFKGILVVNRGIGTNSKFSHIKF